PTGRLGPAARRRADPGGTMTTTTTRSKRPPGRRPDQEAAVKATAVKAPAKPLPDDTVKASPKPVKASPKPKTAPDTEAKGTGTAAGRARVQAGRTAAARTPRAPFVLLILALLGGALISLLLLNTVLAKDAFTLTELQQSNKQLVQQRQALLEAND